MRDHGRFVETQERVSKNMERRSDALADGGSHPNHGFSGFVDQVLVSRRGLAGYRIMAKVVNIGGSWPPRTRDSPAFTNSLCCCWVKDLAARMPHPLPILCVSMLS
jgi:hypothetical protein